MNKALARKLLSNVNYAQSRNAISNRPVRAIEITYDDLIKKFDEQKGTCFWSGLPLDSNYNYVKHHPFAISVERLDNSKCYTYDNVVLTRRLFNLGRMAFDQNQFKDVVKALKEEFRDN